MVKVYVLVDRELENPVRLTRLHAKSSTFVWKEVEMVDSIGPIASAVILPDPEPEVEAPQSQRAVKRRQSSTSDPASKRPRLSNEGSADSSSIFQTSPRASDPAPEPARETVENLNTERRNSRVQEERKRGQRLFGGLLNTLSQSTSSGPQKRRLEIEKRQQEKAKQQKVEDEERRAEKLTKLKAIRKVEQVKVDEQSMRMRHSNMLATAHFLCTKIEPKLYYKPWELLPGDEDRIKTQIADVEAIIEWEVEAFKSRHPEHQEQDKPAPENTNGTSNETVGEHNVEPSSVSNVVDSTNKPPPAQTHNVKATTEREAQDENGEVVVEAEEDTVIY